MSKSETSSDGGLVEARRLLAARQAAVEVAGRLLEEAANQSPGEQQASLGQVCYQLGKYDTAREHLIAAFKLTENPDTAIRLALTEWRAGDLDAARTWTERAIELEPTGRFETLIAKTTSTYCAVLAEIHLRQGNIVSAEASANAALNIDDRDVTALTVLSTIHLAKGDGESAATLVQRAFEAAPEFQRAELGAKRATLDAFVRQQSPMTVDFANVIEVVI